MSARFLLGIAAIALFSCDHHPTDLGRVDANTWDTPTLKTRTSPDRQLRARADLDDKHLKLQIGDPGDDPVDITVLFSNELGLPPPGWDIRWIDDAHLELVLPEGGRVWRVQRIDATSVSVVEESPQSGRR